GVGVAAIDAAARPLVQMCLEGLQSLKVDLLTPADPAHIAGILAFRHPDADRIHKTLHAAGVHVMSSAGRLRIAIHGYNTVADIERLLSTLRGIV
ncbi:MAG: aminotransferase, partial [Planctomycetaceae bacterium]|nr:aminotransferase [Planctomycetaceae bacterium]